MTRTITALFDTVDAANRAARDVAERIGGIRGTIYHARSTEHDQALAIPAEDKAVLDENIRRGGAVFYAHVPDDKFDAVATALGHAGAADFGEKEAAWRREGWTTPSATGAAGTAHTASSATAHRDRNTAATEERVPLAEEQIAVGKREVNHGHVRVRSYVVETPVEERITLRDEHVDVERRPADRSVQPSEDAFRDRVIEVAETDEEAVVSKDVRVREEVVIRKDVEERVETVHDTVRRTEVEVERDTDRPAARTAAGGAKGGTLGSHRPDDTSTNPPGTAASRATDSALGTNISGAHPEHENPDGTPGNPPGTMASRAADKALGTNISGANPNSRKE